MKNFLYQLIHTSKFRFIDVRSEDEFSEGHFPGAINLPILVNEHRRLVGTCYKKDGQNAAIKLGHDLVDPLRHEYVKQWKEVLEGLPPEERYLHCWRGGMRSALAKEWIEKDGYQVQMVEGGYKAVRKHLLSTFEKKYNLIVVSGLTGTGKSKLLEKINQEQVIDLEKYANHRGSAFGGFHHKVQSSQQFFENQLALKLYEAQPVYAIEHESRFVGKNIIPPQFFEQINSAPEIMLEATMQERVESIHKAYITEEIGEKTSENLLGLQEKMLASLSIIARKLGGKLAQEIRSDMKVAFSDFQNTQKHYQWIEKLLEHYYDKRYNYSQNKNTSPKYLFRGDIVECQKFLQDYIVRRRTL